jgi:hypothetical protein
MTFWRDLRWALFGAILGNLSASTTNEGVHQIGQLICPGERLLAKGLTLRQDAISQHDAVKHRQANAEFEQAMACGNTPEAAAWLGQAYCYPDWGMALDRERGMRMIREAYWRGARLSPDWFLDKDVCPAPKP